MSGTREGGTHPRSAARQWPPIARFICAETALGDAASARGPWVSGGYEFLRFGIKQGWACLFGAMMLALMIVTHVAYPVHAFLSRYDFLFLSAVSIQIGMLTTRLETLSEAKVICAFHLIGTIMELHKTSIGSWTYPEHSLFHIGGVPLFTGFMYGSVGSYLARVWRLFDFRFTRHPGLILLGHIFSAWNVAAELSGAAIGAFAGVKLGGFEPKTTARS